MSTLNINNFFTDSAQTTIESLAKYAEQIYKLEIEIADAQAKLIETSLEKEVIEAAITSDVYADKLYTNDVKRKCAVTLMLEDTEKWVELEKEHNSLKDQIVRLNAEKSYNWRMYNAYQTAVKVAILGKSMKDDPYLEF